MTMHVVITGTLQPNYIIVNWWLTWKKFHGAPAKIYLDFNVYNINFRTFCKNQAVCIPKPLLKF